MKETKSKETGGRGSECLIVPKKQGNSLQEDPEEGRGHRGIEPLKGKMDGTSSPASVSTKLQRIAELSRKRPEMVWTTLAHHIDLDWLKVAYHQTRKDGAVGIDGQTAKEYAESLEENLQSLLDRFKSGTYKAPPVRRTYIPKGDGTKTRPIGIRTFEDKVLQRAVAMALEAVYEQDFLGCSYGFRPGRSAHQATEALRSEMWRVRGGFVLEADIRTFFDSLDHTCLREILDKRVRDGVIRRAIDKWLRAGALEEGKVERSGMGTPQGGVISPMLSNIFLHEVLDKWFAQVVKPRLRGYAALVRYADDWVAVFSDEGDAKRVMTVLPNRFGRFGLKLHPEKTRLLPFNPPDWHGDKADETPGKGLGSFDFLGFTFYWARMRKDGKWMIKLKTSRDRLTRSLKRITQWCKRHRHGPIEEQHRMLVLKLRGHYQYFGVIGNGKALNQFYHEVRRIWRKWLNRRSTNKPFLWDKFVLLLKRYPLPYPRVAYPSFES